MSHQIHHTDAVVLSRFSRGEHDMLLSLYTESFGRVYAVAIGARKETSKLRFALQPLTLVRVALVRGREQWRVTGASVLQQPYYHPGLSHDGRALLARLMMMVRRLVAGEDPNPDLFALLTAIVHALPEVSQEPDALEAFEHVALVRLCARLGYGPSFAELETSYLAHLSFAPTVLQQARADRARLERHIADALHSSQL